MGSVLGSIIGNSDKTITEFVQELVAECWHAKRLGAINVKQTVI